METLNNHRTLADMLDRAEELGQMSGFGLASLPMLAMDVAIGVRDGSFVNVAQVKGKENDIHSMWKRYAKGQNAKAPAERSAKSISSHVSRLQAIADAAGKMKDFAGDVMVRVCDTRELLLKDTASKVKTWPLYDCYVNAARLQNDAKNQTILSDELVTSAIVKVVVPKTLVEHLQEIQKSVLDLIDPKSAYQVDTHYKYLVEGASADIGRLVDAAKRAAMTPEEREEHDAMIAARDNVRFNREQAEKQAAARALEVGNAISEEREAA